MLNKIDIAILRTLDQNARQPISHIAKKVKLSKEVVNYRIAKLEKIGVIEGYYPVINGFQLGNNLFKLLIQFKNVNKTKEEQIINWLKLQKEVIWVGNGDGRWNLIITFQTKTISQFISFIFLCLTIVCIIPIFCKFTFTT